MTNELRGLEQEYHQVESSRSGYESSMSRATAHRKEEVDMKREALRAQSLLRREAKAIANLRTQQERLLASRGSLMAKLDMIMQPKVRGAESRIQEQQKAVDAAVKRESTWATKAGNLKEQALQALKTRDEAQSALEETEKKLAEVQAELTKGTEFYRRAKLRLRSQVEAARWAATELSGASAHRTDQETGLQDAMSAKKEVEQIYAAEVARIDEALAQGKANMQKKVEREEGIAQEAEQASLVLRKRYQLWKSEQMHDEDEAEQSREKYQELLKGYQAHRQAITREAESRAVHKAEARRGQSGDWAWDGSAEDAAALDALGA